jgi:hypothetical protein
MDILKKLVNIEKSFSWSFLGFVLAALFGGLNIYQAFFYEERPVINFKTISNIGALDIREDIPNLEIKHNNIDIVKSGINVRVIRIKVSNIGNHAITHNSYDLYDKFGFEIKHGNPSSEPIIISTSNEYLKNNLKVTADPEKANRYYFTPIILESGDHFSFKAIISHKKDKIPNLLPVGKIANIHKFNLEELESTPKTEGFISNVFSGGYIYIIGKILIYGFIALLFLTVAIIIHEKRGELREIGKRKKILKIYFDYNKKEPTPLELLKKELYLDDNLTRLYKLHCITRDISRGQMPITPPPKDSTHNRIIDSSLTQADILNNLTELSIIEINQGGEYRLTLENINRHLEFHSHLMKHDSNYSNLARPNLKKRRERLLEAKNNK